MPTLSRPLPRWTEAARAGVAWWLDELRAMIPARLSQWIAGRKTSIDIIIRVDETCVERIHAGVGERLIDPRHLEDLDAQTWGELLGLMGDVSPRLVLTSPDIYCVTLAFPRQVGRRLRQAVALQLEEVAPLPVDLLRWAFGPTNIINDKIQVDVAMVQSDRIDALTAILSDHGLPPSSIVAKLDQGHAVIQETRPLSSVGFGARLPWLIGLALIASIPVTTITVTSLLTWSNKREIAALDKQVQDVIAAERHARHEADLREALAPIANAIAASAILDDLAKQLPEDASLASAERDQQGHLDLTINAPDTDAVRGALSHDALFRFKEVDETADQDGRIQMMFRASRR